MNTLIIIPARGGSKGIPRKNLRPLNKKPLIYYVIKTALSSKYNPDVYVSSEDSEILMFAERFGARTHKRSDELSSDQTTLDPVIYNSFIEIESDAKKKYDFIITIQPTSPTLSTETLDLAIEKIISNKRCDTIISAVESAHLNWYKENNKYLPNYKERVNRQYLEPVYQETGAFVICKRKNLIENKIRIYGNIDLFLLNDKESIDIDTYQDWMIADYLLKNKKILFVVTGNNTVGLGHIYRALLIANEIMNHQIIFLVDKNSKIGYDKIRSLNYQVFMQQHENILDDINKIDPHVIVNDILDTDKEYIFALKNKDRLVINFEDLGTGASKADLVINALYPEKEVLKNHYFGHKYFCARDEFFHSNRQNIREKVKNILISFGGTDSNNLTLKVLDSISDQCNNHNIKINVVLGFGNSNNYSEYKDYSNINILIDIKDISSYMMDADIIFTSAGRTVYEIACIGTPAIILAQNERELTHFFASPEFGFINLGLGYKLKNKEIQDTFINLKDNFQERQNMQKVMLQKDILNGKRRTMELINSNINSL